MEVQESNMKIEDYLNGIMVSRSTVGVFHINGHKIETRVVSVTPELASEILSERNNSNRKINPISVGILTKEMLGGNWIFNGDSIRFNTKGVLIDGQHRLLALIKANTTQDLMVVTGLKDETFETIDVGIKRSASDTLSIYHIPDPTLTASIVKFIYAFENGKYSANRNTVRNLNNQEIMPYYNSLDNIQDTVEFIKRIKKEGQSLVTPAVMGGLHYLMHKVDADLANEFIEKMCVGNNVSPTSPITALRNKLIKAKTNSKYKLTNKSLLENIIQTWNYVKGGVSVKHIQIKGEIEMDIK